MDYFSFYINNIVEKFIYFYDFTYDVFFIVFVCYNFPENMIIFLGIDVETQMNFLCVVIFC